MLKTDVEVFQGKIVFNVDGNSFIIATENSTQDLILNCKQIFYILYYYILNKCLFTNGLYLNICADYYLLI